MTEPDRLLKPVEVAELFRVDRKTVTRWAQAGRLNAVKTPGGHHRFYRSDVLAFFDAQARR
jgi:excisionase family DNA binding protein